MINLKAGCARLIIHFSTQTRRRSVSTLTIGADTDLENGSMGMWKATLSLTVTMSDLVQGKRLVDSQKESGSVLSFDKKRWIGFRSWTSCSRTKNSKPLQTF
jgi:hypothetical protein